MMEQERTDCFKRQLKYGGMWLNFSHLPYGYILTMLQIFRFVYLVLGWFMIWNSFFTKGISFLLTTTAVFIPLGLNIVCCTVMIFLHLKSLEKLIAESEKHLSSFEENWEKAIISSDTELIKKFSKILNLGLYTFEITYIFLPLIIDGIKAALGYPEPYIVPLPYAGYFDEVITRNFKFYSIIICSDLWFMFAVPNTIALQCSIFYAVSYTTTQIKVVKEHLRMLHDRSDRNVLLMKDWKLKHIIKIHQQIVRLNGLQRKHITLPFVTQEVVAGASFCFVMYLINQTMGKDTVVTILGCVFIVVLLGIVSIMCYTGEYLEEMGENLFQEICDLPWYRQHPRARQDFLMLLTQASQDLVLDYGRSFSLNLKTLMQIVNTAYSYYMIMKSAT